MTTSSVVLFNPDLDELDRLVSCLLGSKSLSRIYLIDNSIKKLEKTFESNSIIKYIHNPSNPGFGSAHNIAIAAAINENSDYHFIINPDIYFETDVINPMVAYMSKNNDVGMMMPEVLNEDGSIQYLPKLLPSPLSIILRKLKLKRFIEKYEMRNMNDNLIYNVPILSGSFTLLRLQAIKEIGMYDDKFFMYFEDWDLSRRIHKKYKTLYFPLAKVIHGYDSGANKNIKLLKIFIKSMIYYFNKWGWIFDNERRKMNRLALKQLK